MSESKADEARRVARAATKGPWLADSGLWMGLAFGVVDDGGQCIAACREVAAEADRRNAAFIAWARNNIEAMADEFDALRAENERLEKRARMGSMLVEGARESERDLRAELASKDARIRELEGALAETEAVIDDVLQQYEGNPPKHGENQIKDIHCRCLDALSARETEGE